jgi:hypothetical protein
MAESSKVVSLCASKQLSKENGRLSYRFGPLGKVELEFPSAKTETLQQFRLAHYFRFQTDRTEVSFSNGKFTYSIFDYYDEQETPKYSRGISLNSINGQGREIQLLCGAKIISELQKLEGVLPCDTNSEFANCK